MTINTVTKLGEHYIYTRNGAINVREDGIEYNSDGIPYLDINAEEISLPFKVLNTKGTEQSLSEVKVTAEGFLERPTE